MGIIKRNSEKNESFNMNLATLRSRQISKLPKIFLCRPEMGSPVKKHLMSNKKIESFN